MILLKKFAESRGESAHTVATYIRRHPDMFDGHTQLDGNRLMLDDIAVELLDEVYPLPRPVEVIQDTELLRKYSELQESFIEVLRGSSDMKAQLVSLEKEKLLLEYEIKDKVAAAVDDAKAELQAKHDAEVDEMRAEHQKVVEDLMEQLESERNRKWWQRFFG